jgi:hypothetical protein
MTGHHTTSRTTTAKAGRPLAGHQGGEIGQGDTQGGGEGREAGSRWERCPTLPGRNGDRVNPDRLRQVYPSQGL